MKKRIIKKNYFFQYYCMKPFKIMMLVPFEILNIIFKIWLPKKSGSISYSRSYTVPGTVWY